jgi:hypothetical protein
MQFILGIRPGPRLLVYFRNRFTVYGEKFLAPRPTPKFEDHFLSAVRDCLFNIFEATLAVFFVRNLRTRHAVVTRDLPNMDRKLIVKIKLQATYTEERRLLLTFPYLSKTLKIKAHNGRIWKYL